MVRNLTCIGQGKTNYPRQKVINDFKFQKKKKKKKKNNPKKKFGKKENKMSQKQNSIGFTHKSRLDISKKKKNLDETWVHI